MVKLYRYAAFISYSSRDSAFAAKLHQALERYGIPATLGTFDLLGQGGKRNRIYPVFRDREELPAGNLGAEIEAALEASNSLIVICSPEAARSPWVAKEIETFRAMGRPDRIFAIISPRTPLEIEGRDATIDSFPPQLLGDAASQDGFEPIAADARPGKDEFRSALLKLVSGMIGVKPGMLADRDRKRRRAASIRTGILALAVAILVVSIWQIGASRVASAKRAEHARAAQSYAERSRVAKAAYQNNMAVYFAAQSLTESRLAERAPVDVDLFTSLSPAASFRYANQVAKDVSTWSVSPDRRLLAVGGSAAFVNVLDLASGRKLRSLARGGPDMTALAFIDNRQLAIGDRAGNLVIHDTATGRRLSTNAITPDAIVAMALRDAGGVLVVATRSHIILFDTSARRTVTEREIPDDSIERIAIGPGGGTAASLSSDYSVQIWSLANLEATTRRAYQQAPRAIAYAPRRDLLLVSTWDRAIHLVDARNGAESGALRGPGSAIEAIDVSPDGRLLVSGDRDGLSHLWDLDAGQVVEALGPRSAPVVMAKFLNGGKGLAILDRSGLLKVWDVAQNAEQGTIRAHFGAVRGVFWPSRAGASLISVGDDGMARIWNAETGEKERERNAGIYQISASALAPDGTLLATGGAKGAIALWDVPGLAQRSAFKAHSGRVAGLAFVGDGQLLASASWDGTIGLWNAKSGALLRRIAASPGELTGIAASPSGDLVASTGRDGSLRLFRVADGKEVAVYQGRSGFLRVVRFNPDGSILAWSGQDGIVRLARPSRLASPVELIGQSKEIWALAYSPEGRYVLSGSRSDGDFQTLRVWDLSNRQLLARPNAHFEFTLAACFSPDGRRFVTGGNDGLIKTWATNSLLQANVADRDDAAKQVYRLALQPDAGSRQEYEVLLRATFARTGETVATSQAR